MIGLFTLACLVININFYALNVDLDHLYVYMIEQRGNGTYDLGWFGQNPVWIPRSLTVLQVLLGLGGYLGSLFFFFHSRRHPAKT